MVTPIVLFALFLSVLALIGFAALRVFTTRDAEGRRQPVGCFSGCLLGLGLAILGVIALGALFVSLSVNTVTEGIGNLPVRSVTLVREDGPDDPEVRPFHDPSRPLHVIFEIEGAEAPTERLVQVLQDIFEGEAHIEITRTLEDGTQTGVSRTIVDVAVPASGRDLRKLERELRNIVLPGLDLDEGLRVRMKTRRDV
jgi:hypothetical protein